MQKLKNVIKASAASILLAYGISSCAATSTAIDHSDLDAESKMSNSIFLDPLDMGDKTIYVQIKNTSTENLSNLTAALKDNLRNGGYEVVNDPHKAHDLLQVNILQYGAAKTPEEVWKSMNSGYGSVMTGALAGIGVGVLSGSAAWGVGVGLGVAAASWIADQMVKDKAYSLITDVQVSVQKPDKSWKRYNTRVASEVDKVNLKFNEAKPVLVEQLSREIAGIFVSNN